MSMIDWIVGAEAAAATIAAVAALTQRDDARAQVRFWRAAHGLAQRRLQAEREANLLPPIRPRGRRFSLDAQETSKPG